MVHSNVVPQWFSTTKTKTNEEGERLNYYMKTNNCSFNMCKRSVPARGLLASQVEPREFSWDSIPLGPLKVANRNVSITIQKCNSHISNTNTKHFRNKENSL